jgi:hypothetical protein
MLQGKKNGTLSLQTLNVKEEVATFKRVHSLLVKVVIMKCVG